MQRTHEKVRTLTCLARRLSLASRLEHSNQTNNSRRWPSVPCFPGPWHPAQKTITTGSWSWLRIAVPSRIAHPWRRVSQVRLRGCYAEVPVVYRPDRYPGNYFSQYIANKLCLLTWPTLAFHSTATSHGNARDLLTISSTPVAVKRRQAIFFLPACLVRWRGSRRGNCDSSGKSEQWLIALGGTNTSNRRGPAEAVICVPCSQLLH